MKSIKTVPVFPFGYRVLFVLPVEILIKHIWPSLLTGDKYFFFFFKYMDFIGSLCWPGTLCLDQAASESSCLCPNPPPPLECWD